jgi:hypothetical protein
MLAHYSSFEALVLCHLVLLYTQIRDPTYRIIIGIFAVIAIIFGYSHMSSMTGLAKMKAIAVQGGSPSANTTPVNPPDIPTNPPVEEV